MVTTVWIIQQHGGGGPEPNGTFSIWTTKEAAERERLRLIALEGDCYTESQAIVVGEVPLDTPNDRYYYVN